jgi:hypothetical protein
LRANGPQDHWLPGCNFDVEEWDAKRQTHETLAICRTLAFARVVFAAPIAEKPADRFMIRSRTRAAPGGQRLVRRQFLAIRRPHGGYGTVGQGRSSERNEVQ